MNTPPPEPLVAAIWAWRREFDRMLQPRERWPAALRGAVEYLEGLKDPHKTALPYRDDEQQLEFPESP